MVVAGGDCGQGGCVDAVKAMKGVAPDILVTYHPIGPSLSSQWYFNESWYNFSGFQTGHRQRDWDISYTYVQNDYALTPPKPTVDLEARYEYHCINWNCANGRFDDYDVRQAAYWSVFAGAAGQGYGAQGLWDTNADQNQSNEGMNRPGAWDMGHVRALVESRPYFSRVPDQSLIASGQGSGADHMQACRGNGYAFVYFSTGQTASINTSKINASQVRAWWFDPREGTAQQIDESAPSASRQFDPPGNNGRGNDWVLVLDDVSKGFGEPGSEPQATAIISDAAARSVRTAATAAARVRFDPAGPGGRSVQISQDNTNWAIDGRKMASW